MTDLIDEWGSKAFGKHKRGRKAKADLSKGTGDGESKKKSSGIYKTKFKLLSQKAPEVMVKISGAGKNMGQIKAHLDYIGRNGEVEIEDEQGNRFNGKDDIAELRDMWESSGYKIRKNGKERREAFNIVLSMPPGTNRVAVTEAARSFAKDEFKGHQYAFATHDDEKHPHVHLVVKAVSLTGQRLNPRKADLQDWREHFAEKLREEGIAANATRRFIRGRVNKAEKQAIIHIDRDFKEGKRSDGSYVLASRAAEAVHANPLLEKIHSSRKKAVQILGTVAKHLARSSDKDDHQISLGLVSVVKGMQPVSPETQKLPEVSRGEDRDRSKPSKDKER